MKENLDITSIPLIGRFAPSPTGPLHFGTLLAALGSYLAAKQSGGQWLMRVEDLDLPRVVAGSADRILLLLDQLGFEWDGPILYQSQRFERYREILDSLRSHGFLFDCSCSRKEILASAPHPGEEGPIYPGTCRNGPLGTRPQHAVRLRVNDQSVIFTDQVFGRQSQNLEKQVGDFVLHRSDGVFAYQLAVVVDDIDTGVSQVVRGADLLSSTARQIYLYQCLQSVVPEYLHLPLVFGDDGMKLSKRNGLNGMIDHNNGARMIWQGLDFLGQMPPVDLYGGSSAELLRWGVENFESHKIPTVSRYVQLI